VLYASQRHGGNWISAAFDYGSFVCHFETGVDSLPRYDTYLEVYGDETVLCVRYDSPYVRHLPTYLETLRSTGGGAGLAEERSLPSWADPFVEEWRAFARSVRTGEPTKTPPADFREDLELFAAMMERLRSAG
jgi:predicted dehydrogenase